MFDDWFDFSDVGDAGDSLGNMDTGLGDTGWGGVTDYGSSGDYLQNMSANDFSTAGNSLDSMPNYNAAADSGGGNYGLNSLWDMGKSAVNKIGGQNIIKGAAALYDMNNKQKMAQQLMGPIQQLNNMYAPGTPEADQMRQQIERRDAASGRRSQYGTREVELASQLAAQRSKNLTSPGYYNLNAAYANADNSGLSALFKLAGDSTTEKKNFADGGQVRSRFSYAPIPEAPSLGQSLGAAPMPSPMTRLGMPAAQSDGNSPASTGPNAGYGSYGDPNAAVGAFGWGAANALGFGVPGAMSAANIASNAVTGHGIAANVWGAFANALGLGDNSDASTIGTGVADAVANDANPADSIGTASYGQAVANAQAANSDSSSEGASSDGGEANSGSDGQGESSAGSAGWANGGKIAGYDPESSDDVPINVSHGEYIMPVDVVNKLGVDFFDGLKSMYHTPVRRK